MTFRRHGERALHNPRIVGTLESLLLIDFNYLRVRRGAWLRASPDAPLGELSLSYNSVV